MDHHGANGQTSVRVVSLTAQNINKDSVHRTTAQKTVLRETIMGYMLTLLSAVMRNAMVRF